MIHYVDTHCHLDLYDSPADIATEAESAGIYTIAMTNSPSVFEHTLQLAAGRKFVRAAVGLHPQLVAERSCELAQIWPCLDKTRYVGEIGLDYCDTTDTVRQTQRQVFSQILEKSAQFGDKVVSVHSRRAVVDVVSMIGSRYPGTVILHWFSGTTSELNRAVSAGSFFSVNHQMLKGQKGRDLIAGMPPEKVLTESDGPFTKIDRNIAGPTSMPRIVDELSSIWHIDPEQARDRVFGNFRQAIQPRLDAETKLLV